MARCPNCRSTFRTLEDEATMHECPRCGWAPWWADEPAARPCHDCGGPTDWGAVTTHYRNDAGQAQSVRRCAECAKQHREVTR